MTLTIESDSSVDLSVYGLVDNESNEWHELGAISLIDYEPITPIDAAGAYAFVVAGINKVKVVNNGTAGSCVVFGTLSD